VLYYNITIFNQANDSPSTQAKISFDVSVNRFGTNAQQGQAETRSKKTCLATEITVIK